MDSLNVKFPQLPWTREADSFLGSIRTNHTSPLQQLKSRRIYQIVVCPLASHGGISIDEKGFVVYINNSDTIDQRTLTFGHEIGHTFHYLLSSPTPLSTLTKQYKHKVVEEYCEAFAHRWVAASSLGEVWHVVNPVLLSQFATNTLTLPV